MTHGTSSYLDDQRGRASRVGRDVSTPVLIRHLFQSPGQRPDDVERRLWEMDAEEVLVDEEISGDGFWFVAADTSTLLTESEIAQLVTQMERIGKELGVRYRGWRVIFTVAEERQLREL